MMQKGLQEKRKKERVKARERGRGREKEIDRIRQTEAQTEICS